jgi:cell wall assembly regulator SMI1
MHRCEEIILKQFDALLMERFWFVLVRFASDANGDEDRIEWITEKKIQPVMWDSRWVSFSDCEGSPRLILDLHPGRSGTSGQVWQDLRGCDLEDGGTLIAPTFAEFSTELLRRLTIRGVAVDGDGRLSFAREAATGSCCGQARKDCRRRGKDRREAHKVAIL